MYVDWTREDVPRAFYVGEGQGRRAKNFKRNNYHMNIVQKHGIRREIVEWFDTKQEALLRETELMFVHRTIFRIHGWGANFLVINPGGFEGTIQTPESNAKRSATLKGQPKKPFSEEHKRNMRTAFAHRPPVSDETRTKMSSVRKGVKKSEAYSRNRRLANQLRREAELRLQAETASDASASTGSQSDVKQ